ncbi:MAG: alginate export family protein [Xanthomonadales bacterium]|nr:alginate export family protein [Xanthomonadales bacterium]
MNSTKYFLASLLGLSVLASAAVAAAEPAASADIHDPWHWAFRYRLEAVDQDGFTSDATASTLRARVNYQSPERHGFSLFAELDYVAELFADDYDAGAGNTPGRGRYPVVADPDGVDLNQAYLQFSHGNQRIRAGRQRIIFDNARFVGNVGWRQNEQTYDALSYRHAVGGGEFTLAWVDNVNRIFGDDVAAGDHGHQAWLANLALALDASGKLSLYAYDIDNRDIPNLSNMTLGARFDGSLSGEESRFRYTIEAARQYDNGGPVAYDASYYRLDLSAKFPWATVYGGVESLGGDSASGGKAFRTPLATLHAFNGWADQFLATPDAGLVDRYAGVQGQAGAWAWNLLYHDFEAESGSLDFGSELDLSFSRKLGQHYGLLLKAARFNANAGDFNDVTKVWVQLTAGF